MGADGGSRWRVGDVCGLVGPTARATAATAEAMRARRHPRKMIIDAPPT
jgi:hypothetical protein